MSSLLDSDILYVVSLGDAPSSFFFSRPCGKTAAGLFLCNPAWSHLLQNLILPVSLCSDFTLKSVGQFQHELHAGKIFCSGVSKIADFRHVDMEGQMKGALPA